MVAVVERMPSKDAERDCALALADASARRRDLIVSNRPPKSRGWRPGSRVGDGRHDVRSLDISGMMRERGRRTRC
jgi:hypothetical protein